LLPFDKKKIKNKRFVYLHIYC